MNERLIALMRQITEKFRKPGMLTVICTCGLPVWLNQEGNTADRFTGVCEHCSIPWRAEAADQEKAVEPFEQSYLDQQYLQNPNECPFCGSGDIDFGRPVREKDDILICVRCFDCFKVWQERYQLQGILEVSELEE